MGIPMAINTTKVANVTARGVARADRQREQASPLDVWTNTGEGISVSRQAYLDDPVGFMRAAGEGRARQDQALLDPAQWEASGLSETQDAFIAAAEGVGDAAFKVTEADGALATTGAVFATLTSLEQTLSVPFSAVPFPAFPAVRVTDMAVGLPHAHNHPPNLVPPAPPVPLPSAGPVIPIPYVSGAATVLVNNLPAARCGDMGLGIWCGGYFPMYEIFLGSSSVWLEGARAARLAIDITKHCIFTTPKPLDPPIGPMTGVTVTSSANVIIGGVPMPSLTAAAVGAAFKAAFRGLGRFRNMARAADDVAEEGADAARRAADDIPGSRPGNFDDAITQEMPALTDELMEMNHIARSVNPLKSNINCGWIIDAVFDRLTGKNVDAIAPPSRDGTWEEIGQRFQTQFLPTTIDDAFTHVGGRDGRRMLVGMERADGSSHVVMLANKNGTVGMIEGQGGGRVFTDAASANAHYSGNGTTFTGAVLD